MMLSPIFAKAALLRVPLARIPCKRCCMDAFTLGMMLDEVGGGAAAVAVKLSVLLVALKSREAGLKVMLALFGVTR